MKRLFYLPFLLLVFSSCTEEDVAKENIHVNELWRIPVDDGLWFGDGAVYGDAYLTWGNAPNGTRLLIAFDINTKEKIWEFDFTQHYGWGQEMQIKNGFLYSDKQDLGFTIFDLKSKVVTGSVRYDNMPGFTSVNLGSFHNNNLYKAIYAPYDGFCVALSYDRTDLSYEIVFQWLQNPDLKVKFTSPTVIHDENQQRNNLIMLLNLRNKNVDPDTLNFTLLVNANEDYSINWFDTIDISSGFDFNIFSPVHHGNDVLFVLGQTLYSYNYVNGDVNWKTVVNGNAFSKIVKVDDEFYVILSNSRFLKFNPDNGQIIWTNSIGRAPSTIGDFELYQDKIVYSNSGFGSLIVLNNSNGEIETIDNLFNIDIGNPKLYDKEGMFIAHSNNEIIAFKLEE